MRRLLILPLLLVVGCERRPPPANPPRPPATRPTTQPTTASAPSTQPTASKPPEPPPPPKTPKRPEPSWASLMDVFDTDRDAAIRTQVVSASRLAVHTENIRVLQLDLNKLPESSAKRGPWNLRLDDQVFELTGRRGKVIEFQRSSAGVWEIAEPKRRPATRSP